VFDDLVITENQISLHKEIVKALHKIEKYKEIPLTFLKKIQRNAQKRNLECSISIEQIWEIFINQNSFWKTSHYKILKIKKFDPSRCSNYEVSTSCLIYFGSNGCNK
jgi:hypothetical protein